MKYYFVAQVGEDGGNNGIITTSLDKLKNVLELWCEKKNFKLPYYVRIVMDDDVYQSNTKKASDFRFHVEMECQPYAEVGLSTSYDIQSELLEDKELFKII